MLNRRYVVGGFGALFASAIRAQPARTRLVGVLNRHVVSDAEVAFFSGALRDLGWPLGSVRFMFRGVDQRLELFIGFARELVELGVDLIMVPSGTSVCLAAKQATSTVPILAIGVADPVRSG